MTETEEAENQRALAVALDILEAVQNGNEEQYAPILTSYFSSAESIDEERWLSGKLMLAFAKMVMQLTDVLGGINPASVEYWRKEMRKLAGLCI
jgi:hypothetical protein